MTPAQGNHDMTSARETADGIMDGPQMSTFICRDWREWIGWLSVRDAIEAAITSAREAGRVEGLEEGAKVADAYNSQHVLNTQIALNVARNIATDIRALKTETRT